MVCEDEEVVRRLVCDALRACGYVVLETAGAEEAMRICEEHGGTIDLIVTDVVMPRVGGHELAEHAARVRPGIKVLYMSGYTADTIAHRGVLDPGIALIQKPFTLDALARRVRDVLDAP